MRGARAIAAAISALALMGAAGAVRAESVHTTVGGVNLADVAMAPNEGGVQPSHRLFQWDKKGRWSLKLDMSEPVGREMQLGDVQAGAYYRVTPSLRVGAAVSLGDQARPDQSTTLPQAQTQSPRVKLETSFKF
jgi:hypothetical protein